MKNPRNANIHTKNFRARNIICIFCIFRNVQRNKNARIIAINIPFIIRKIPEKISMYKNVTSVSPAKIHTKSVKKRDINFFIKRYYTPRKIPIVEILFVKIIIIIAVFIIFLRFFPKILNTIIMFGSA